MKQLPNNAITKQGASVDFVGYVARKLKAMAPAQGEDLESFARRLYEEQMRLLSNYMGKKIGSSWAEEPAGVRRMWIDCASRNWK